MLLAQIRRLFWSNLIPENPAHRAGGGLCLFLNCGSFLDRNQVQCLVFSPSVAYTALQFAARTHIKGKELAKTFMVLSDGRPAS